MTESLLVGLALLASPLAALIAELAGRRSADAAARVAASVVGAGWLAAVALAVPVFGTSDGADTSRAGIAALTVDGLAVVMVLLVLGLSSVIQFFAVRYLRGDARQVWFVATANLLTGATAVMVCAGTVVTFGLAWVAAGISLVALLRTYPQLAQARQGARRTARNVALGDAVLVGAIAGIVFVAGGDIPLADVGDALAEAPAWVGALLAVLLVVPALARSSQVPFHGWLPSTLAAPTPVSALMHAGVVNAGAILILRFSPLIGESALAMSLIFALGAVTVVYASIVRLVKPDVKGRLVFSTMAQMGFMFLACGLGAFAAAVFHLVAHGLFKSALFLGAGSGVSREATQRVWPARRAPRAVVAAAAILLGILVPVAAIVAARAVLSVELSAASQGLQLFVVFTAGIALGTALWTHFAATTAVLGTLAVTALAFGYSALIAGLDSVLNYGMPSGAVGAPWLAVPAAALLALHLLGVGGARGVTRWLYAVTLAAGTPADALRRQPMTIPRGSAA